MARIQSIEDVAARHLCTGCGACAALQPEAIQMVDLVDQGARPAVVAGADTRAAFAACPGPGYARPAAAPAGIAELTGDWGNVLELAAARAADAGVRRRGTAGGVTTALSLFALEQRGFRGVLHVARRDDVPFLNRAAFSTSRAEVVEAAGARYAPAAPCEGLGAIEAADGPCLFVGKPCDVAAAARAAAARPELAERLGLTVALFCAGIPATRGTTELLRAMGFEVPSRVERVDYRGAGWPGDVEVTARRDQRPYVETRAFDAAWREHLAPRRAWRCLACADRAGELGDLALGELPGEPSADGGRAAVLARTERGREFLRAAVAAGVLVVEPLAPAAFAASRADVPAARAAARGAIAAARATGAAAPRFDGLRGGSPWERLRCFARGLREVFARRLHRRAAVRVRTGRLRGIQRFGTDV